MPTTIQMLSSWCQQKANNNVFQVIPGTVSIHSETAPYNYLAVKPDITEKRLNKPIADLIGNPLQIIDPAIAEPRIHAIKHAIEIGGNTTYTYEYLWNGALWRFRVHIAYLVGHSEIMCVTEDLAAWQREYWLSNADD